jgi:hypothetical protein
LVFYNANESHCSEFACCDLLSEAQRSTNTAKFNHAMSKFFDIFGFLQLKELLNELQMEL